MIRPPLVQLLDQTMPHPCSARQERQMLVRAQRGDTQAYQQFVQLNLRLVYWVAAYIYHRQDTGLLTLEDLVQEGYFGLHRAIQKWRPGYRFSTYAVPWIYQAITRAIARTGYPVRIPPHWLDRARPSRVHDPELALEPGRAELEPEPEPEPDQAAAGPDPFQPGVGPNLFRSVRSLDEPCPLLGPDRSDEPTETSWLDQLPDLEAVPVADQVINQALEGACLQLLDQVLNYTERTVVIGRLGLRDGHSQSPAELAVQLGCSLQTVSCLWNQAIGKLQSYLAHRPGPELADWP